jgi:tetratricopeptide (TPR) repeat protein
LFYYFFVNGWKKGIYEPPENHPFFILRGDGPKKKLGFCLVAVLAFFGAIGLSAQEATVKEEKQVIKTYPFSGGDPTPIMTRSSMWGGGSKLYPYYFFDEMSLSGKDQTWNIVRLENPYIQVDVLPAEGGKLIGATEKSTNNNFIYVNHVRKYRQIGLRGPWTSGGIEFNFGITGHQATTATPVDYLTCKNPDGSASCVIGIMDLPSRTHWSVTITVPKDKAYFETRSLFYNPTPLDQAYYVWMNAANKASDDLEFIFPGTQFIGHDYAAQKRPWPLYENGRDLSYYKNHDFDGGPDSLFIFGKLEDFAGGYWHNSQFGFGHWALYEDMPGHKFFRWSLSPSGAIWTDLLTDTDGPYFEPQMGRLFDQEDHEFLTPYSADRWREIWFPYKKIGPMVKASPIGALNVRNEGMSLFVGFCALQDLDEDIVVSAKGKEIYRERLRMKPMEVFEKTLSAAVDIGTLLVTVGPTLTYSDDPKANVVDRPINFRVYDETTPEGLYLSGERSQKERNYDEALKKYMTCLERDPSHLRALTHIAEIYCWRGEYSVGLLFVRKALDLSMYDADANYIYGVISRKMGKFIDAKETLGWAARSMKYRSAAYCQLAEIYIMEGRLDLAQEYAKRSLEYNVNNVKTYQIQATIFRALGQADQARKTLNMLLDLDPLNHLARFELYLLEPNPDNLANFKVLIRNEMPYETFQELAISYVNLQREDDALKLLDVAPEYPTLAYWHAYLLREKDPQKSREWLTKASGLSPYLVFPFREEDIPMFKWVKGVLPDDWKAPYYLGLIYWGKSRNDEARAEFDVCGDKPDFAPFFGARGYLQKGIDDKKSILDFEKALAKNAKDWRNWHHAITAFNERGLFEKALPLAKKAAVLFPKESVVIVDLARTFMNEGLYKDSSDVLQKATILPFEGQSDVHTLFIRGLVCQALQSMKQGRYPQAIKPLEESKTYPERLGTGMPYNPDYRVQDALLLLCCKNMKDLSGADAARKRILDFAPWATQNILAFSEQQIDEWSRTSLSTGDERKALEDLSLLIRGRREERQ